MKTNLFAKIMKMVESQPEKACSPRSAVQYSGEELAK